MLHFLPDPIHKDDHYLPFEEVYGKETSEKFRPLLNPEKEKDHGIPFSSTAHTAKNDTQVVECEECGKRRVLNSKKKLNKIENAYVSDGCANIFVWNFIRRLNDDNGSQDSDSIYSVVYVRKNLNCQNPVEVTYYSAGYSDICYHCIQTSVTIVFRHLLPLYSDICYHCIQTSFTIVFRHLLPLYSDICYHCIQTSVTIVFRHLLPLYSDICYHCIQTSVTIVFRHLLPLYSDICYHCIQTSVTIVFRHLLPLYSDICYHCIQTSVTIVEVTIF